MSDAPETPSEAADDASLAPRPPSPAEPPAGIVPAVVTPAVPPLDPGAIRAARALVAAEPRLGRLGESVVWAAGAQGQSPPRAFTAPVVLVVAGRHDAARYVGRLPADEVDRRVGALRERGAGDLRLRVLDLGEPGEWFASAGAARIDREDALSADEALRAFALGRLAVDQEVDAGADLLVLGDVDTDDGPAAATLVSVLTGREPVACVGRSLETGPWTRTVEVVRDARRRGRPHAAHPLDLLAAVGGADLAALTGALVQAALRETPVLLDGLAAAACGLVAETYAPDCSMWWAAAGRSADPAHAQALKTLDLEPLLDLGLGYDGAASGLLALPLLQAAIRAVG